MGDGRHLPLYALVARGRGIAPRPVSIEFYDHSIELTDLRGEVEEIAYAWLKIREDRGGAIIVGRKWRPAFKLHLSGEAARTAKELLRPGSWYKRASRWALASPKAAMAILALPFFVVDSLPGTWVARATPSALSRGIEATAIDQLAHRACGNAAGNAALQALVRSVAPELDLPKLIVTNDPSFRVSARPGGELLVDRSATTEVEAEVLAALTAHALAHQQAGDVPIAVGRGEESGYLGRLTFFRFSRDLVDLAYTRDEEEKADRAAIVMMQRAGISLKPGADFFAQIQKARLDQRYWAQEYAEEHPGLRNRVATWSAAAAAQRSPHAALNERQSDELFNICWERPEGAMAKWPDENP